MRNNGFSGPGILFALVVVIIIVAGGYWVYSGNHKQAASTKSPTATITKAQVAANPYGVLTPATVASKAAECAQAISYTSDGVPGPVQCSNGDLNVTDWQALAALEPQVLGLGYSASEAQVQSTLCTDVNQNISNPIELTVYQIASLYYGWNFSTNPSVVLTNGTCQNVDD